MRLALTQLSTVRGETPIDRANSAVLRRSLIVAMGGGSRRKAAVAGCGFRCRWDGLVSVIIGILVRREHLTDAGALS